MIAVDWGSTHMRAYLLDADGAIRERKIADTGAMQIGAGRFPDTLDHLVAPWIEKGEGPVFMSGMVGSRQGWQEVPYVPCPATLEDIARGVVQVRWGANRCAYIIPGVCCADRDGVPDVMRGEETQVFGAIARLPAGAVSLCMPGTHSKHALLRDGVLQGFETYMTGELYSVLRQYSILGRTIDPSVPEVDPAAFRAGVERTGDPGGLSHHLFGVRARALAGELASHETGSYLSGILIGHEVRAVRPANPVFIVGSHGLGELYLRAFEHCGVHATVVNSDVAAMGLYRVRNALMESMP
jgi:2-dehydro-3-deoxygalactonokinase